MLCHGQLRLLQLRVQFNMRLIVNFYTIIIMLEIDEVAIGWFCAI